MTETEDPAAPPRLDQWLVALQAAEHDIRFLWHYREVWREVRGALEDNPAFEKTPYFFGVITDLYCRNAVVGVRRQNDHRPGVHTVARLLSEITADRETITRPWFRGLYGDNADLLGADAAFDQYAGTDDPVLSEQWCKFAKAKLEISAKPMRLLANRRIAHWDKREVRVPTFGEMDAALDFLGEALQDLSRLLTGSDGGPVAPTAQFNWLSDLEIGWVPAAEE